MIVSLNGSIMTREQMIHNMCMTFRNDYGMIISEDGAMYSLSAGMSQRRREALYRQMAQIFDNDIAPHMQFNHAYEAAMRIVKSTYPDKFPDAYFICGEGGEKDLNNLPKRIHVCPAYGVDWFQIYERTDKTHGPEY